MDHSQEVTLSASVQRESFMRFLLCRRLLVMSDLVWSGFIRRERSVFNGEEACLYDSNLVFLLRLDCAM